MNALGQPRSWTPPEFLFRVGPRSAPIETPTSGVLADDFSDLLLFWPGSRFGADSQIFAGRRPAAPMGVAAVVRSRRLAVVDRELDCGEDQREQDRDDRCHDRVDVHLRASSLGAPLPLKARSCSRRCSATQSATRFLRWRISVVILVRIIQADPSGTKS